MNGAGALWKETGVRYYVAVCCGSIGLLFAVLNQRGIRLDTLYTILLVALSGLGLILAQPPVGAVRTLFKAVGERAPLIFLVTILCAFSIRETRAIMFAHSPLISDVLLCVGVLGFIASHYRLQGVVKNVFPETSPAPEGETERRRDGETAGSSLRASSRRSGTSVTPAEISWLLLVLLGWAAVAQLLAAALPVIHYTGLIPEVWRPITLVWVLGVVGLLVASILDYYHRRNMSANEATLYLQDVVWAETRGEQRRINRWVAWGRLRCPQSLLSGLAECIGFFALATVIAGCVMLASYLIDLFQ